MGLENQFLVFFLSGHLRQVLLYLKLYQYSPKYLVRKLNVVWSEPSLNLFIVSVNE